MNVAAFISIVMLTTGVTPFEGSASGGSRLQDSAERTFGLSKADSAFSLSIAGFRQTRSP